MPGKQSISKPQLGNQMAFRVSDEDLVTIDRAREIVESDNPNVCTRADIYRKGGIEYARTLVEREPEE